MKCITLILYNLKQNEENISLNVIIISQNTLKDTLLSYRGMGCFPKASLAQSCSALFI